MYTIFSHLPVFICFISSDKWCDYCLRFIQSNAWTVVRTYIAHYEKYAAVFNIHRRLQLPSEARQFRPLDSYS